MAIKTVSEIKKVTIDEPKTLTIKATSDNGEQLKLASIYSLDESKCHVDENSINGLNYTIDAYDGTYSGYDGRHLPGMVCNSNKQFAFIYDYYMQNMNIRNECGSRVLTDAILANTQTGGQPIDSSSAYDSNLLINEILYGLRQQNIYLWIAYYHTEREVTVYASPTSIRPENPLISEKNSAGWGELIPVLFII